MVKKLRKYPKQLAFETKVPSQSLPLVELPYFFNLPPFHSIIKITIYFLDVLQIEGFQDGAGVVCSSGGDAEKPQ